MKKLIFISTLFLSQFSFSQMSKEAVEYEISKYSKNTCYRFSISAVNALKETTKMVEDNFEIKFNESNLTITNGDSYFAIPYTSISMIESSLVASKKDGKFTIYIK